ncbi:MAG: very short patch repair endonuclease [Eggerthellaceae bacterium]|nr:very short patch repair endonuclease [Eggerthellaceae bacterium]
MPPQYATEDPLSSTSKAPTATNEHVRKSMQGNKRRDTKPELVVRRMLREMGYPGYRLDWKKAKGHPDIAYPGRKIAIFVMGCFWHHHEGCKFATTPKQHVDYWQAKFARNKQRDQEVRDALRSEGWQIVEIWECELKKDRLEETRSRLQSEIEYAFIEFPETEDAEL